MFMGFIVVDRRREPVATRKSRRRIRVFITQHRAQRSIIVLLWTFPSFNLRRRSPQHARQYRRAFIRKVLGKMFLRWLGDLKDDIRTSYMSYVGIVCFILLLG
jgi:hypothetical protein